MGASDELCKILCNPTRKSIVEKLYNKVEMKYSELALEVGISESLLNHHLKKLHGIVEKRGSTYRLTQQGRMLYEITVIISRMLEEQTPVVNSSSLTSINVMARRVIAFFIDIVAIFITTGILLDRHLLTIITMTLTSLLTTNISMLSATIQDLIEYTIRYYSNAFIAAYITLTLMEAYNGKTLGKHLLGLRVVKANGSKITLIESGIRNAGKLFLLPLDLLIGVLLYRRHGYIRYTDYYTGSIIIVENMPMPSRVSSRLLNKSRNNKIKTINKIKPST